MDNDKDKYLTQSQVLERGWTATKIAAWLGEPDREKLIRTDQGDHG